MPKPERVSILGRQKSTDVSTSENFDTDFTSLDQEWKEILRLEKNWEDKPVPPYYIFLPVYVAKSGPESDERAKMFLKAREKIAGLFYKKKFSAAIAEIAFAK